MAQRSRASSQKEGKASWSWEAWRASWKLWNRQISNKLLFSSNFKLKLTQILPQPPTFIPLQLLDCQHLVSIFCAFSPLSCADSDSLMYGCQNSSNSRHSKTVWSISTRYRLDSIYHFEGYSNFVVTSYHDIDQLGWGRQQQVQLGRPIKWNFGCKKRFMEWEKIDEWFYSTVLWFQFPCKLHWLRDNWAITVVTTRIRKQI